MIVDELAHSELLELDPAGGIIRFAGQRALVIDAVAMGLLRKLMVEGLGLTATRALLTQFGFAHGWRMAEAMDQEFEWSSLDEWRRAGPRMSTLEGLFLVEPGRDDLLAPDGTTVIASYEAEQHLLHLGRADTPVCWTICGLMSGYVSRTAGAEIYVLEERCMGQGSAACHLVGHTREEWGEDRAEELRFYEAERLSACLDVSLRDVTDALKRAERKLRARRRAVVQLDLDIEEPLGIVAKSPGMRQLVDLARRVAKVDSTVIITGESGAGKERIARLIHEESPRAGGPFIAVSCGAISETLLESELFGHARGAFTGASHARPGLFEAASGGTLLLDEIGEIPAAMQVKLLRALQEREVKRVGENQSRSIDVRLLAATNRDLGVAIASGSFRQDLYYRLKVVELHVPPLRHRAEDILPLARILLADAAAHMGLEVDGLTPRAVDQLLRYDWPGNVRELENSMERAAALTEGSRVDLEDLPADVRLAHPAPTPAVEGVRPLAEVVKEYIIASLAFNDGNQTRTAKQLQIGSATLYRKLKKYGLVDARTPPTKP